MLTEQQWLNEIAPEHGVRKGEVVMDVGAHIGTFGDDALARGASKVIMVEVSPVNAECIRRNFATEIATGRVVLIAEGAWSEESTLEFGAGVHNSGTGSLVLKEKGGRRINVRVRRIDDMLKEHGIQKVDFIKMDIEGAEREALKGASELLRAYRPRVMLDAYHRSDDDVVLPAILKAARSDYRMHCPACTVNSHGTGGIGPYALFFY
jgi:FkbM family methyltransferase